MLSHFVLCWASLRLCHVLVQWFVITTSLTQRFRQWTEETQSFKMHNPRSFISFSLLIIVQLFHSARRIMGLFFPLLFTSVFTGCFSVNAEVRTGEREGERKWYQDVWPVPCLMITRAKDTFTHMSTHMPCDLSISTVVTPAHSLWLFDLNLPLTPGLQSYRNFRKIMLAWHEISDDLCRYSFFFLYAVKIFVWQSKNPSL